MKNVIALLIEKKIELIQEINKIDEFSHSLNQVNNEKLLMKFDETPIYKHYCSYITEVQTAIEILEEEMMK